MSLSIEIQRLLPQALDVIRYLATRENGASIEEMVEGTGLSERVLGKAIRRLVTRYYVEMPAQGFYRLTTRGKQAAGEITDFDGATPSASRAEESKPAPTPAPPAAPRPAAPEPVVERHTRRLSVFFAKEMVIRSSTTLRGGFDAPLAGQPPLKQPARVILRLSAPGCDVAPVERPVEVGINAPAGPIQFQITPRREGTVRVKLEAFQLVTLRDLQPVGGMYFDLNVASFPTPLSAEFQVLGAAIQLYTGPRE